MVNCSKCVLEGNCPNKVWENRKKLASDFGCRKYVQNKRNRRKMENKYCPFCGKSDMRFIEKCDSDDNEIKTAWTCDCLESDGAIVYIYQFKYRTILDTTKK